MVGGGVGGGLISVCSHLSSELMGKVFLLSQVIVPLRSRWQRVDTARAETTTLTGSRPPETNPRQTHGCLQVRTLTPAADHKRTYYLTDAPSRHVSAELNNSSYFRSIGRLYGSLLMKRIMMMQDYRNHGQK